MIQPQPSDLETRDPAARDPQEAVRRASGDAPAFGQGAPAGASEREALGRGPGREPPEARGGASRARGASSRRGLVLFGAAAAALVAVVLLVVSM